MLYPKFKKRNSSRYKFWSVWEDTVFGMVWRFGKNRFSSLLHYYLQRKQKCYWTSEYFITSCWGNEISMQFQSNVAWIKQETAQGTWHDGQWHNTSLKTKHSIISKFRSFHSKLEILKSSSFLCQIFKWLINTRRLTIQQKSIKNYTFNCLSNKKLKFSTFL
jgi:hypothetical protein